MTTLKFTLNLTSISWIFNAFIFAVALALVSRSALSGNSRVGSSFFFMIICFLIASCVINLSINWSSYGVVQVVSYLMPWLAMLMVVLNHDLALKKCSFYWHWANKFLVFMCAAGLFEYMIIFAGGYRPPVMELATGAGEYYVGYSTLFLKVPNLDVPYFRFQGPFGESGDLAMWASVLFIYNILRQQYVYASILAVAMLGAFSPSVVLSLLVAVTAVIVTRSLGLAVLLVTVSVTLVSLFFGDIVGLYDSVAVMKQTSMGDRLDSHASFIQSFRDLLIQHPFGVPFFESMDEKISAGVGFSAAYGAIGNYMVSGFIGLLVYLLLAGKLAITSLVKLISSKENLVENELALYFLMLFTYTVQRATLVDYLIFPFLFAPIIFNKVAKKSHYGNG